MEQHYSLTCLYVVEKFEETACIFDIYNCTARTNIAHNFTNKLNMAT